MEGRITNLSFHVIGYKHKGRFDQYHILVAEAFNELKSNFLKFLQGLTPR